MAYSKADQLTQFILNVFRLNGALTEWGDRFVLPDGLTSTRWRMLGAVALAQRPVTAPQIALTMGVTRQGAQKQLNTLVESGLMETQPNPMHKRSPLYALTESGQSIYDSVNARWQHQATEMAGQFSAAELETAEHVLKSLIETHEKSLAEQCL
ncbi:MarR family winged helix-turn-helix transcriptional regulator (plasmid) [Pantoea agglomerans]|uniref:MarR family winged helix-turn-helix transcriptional regulator n=1 Tax=Enterobacter agglomerans TaxID=549 RepID=UPI001787031F|nr:MarR family winged helix-turn-helix transcriptional regulator [Pantoea agglomerans]WVL91953.1 MarR family winged helix-turn-helix transcriptional regulator [Pantoea agglomerans]